MEKLSPTELHEKYGKRIQVTFRITENAYDRLQQVAQLFNFRNPSQYVKAMLYRELGLFNEPIDNRRRIARRRYREE
jgi:hypothetical protein